MATNQVAKSDIAIDDITIRTRMGQQLGATIAVKIIGNKNRDANPHNGDHSNTLFRIDFCVVFSRSLLQGIIITCQAQKLGI
jgi:hypothetical protein